MGQSRHPNAATPKDYTFSLTVANSIEPDAPFTLLLAARGGGSFCGLMTCPTNATAGSRIPFTWPFCLTPSNSDKESFTRFRRLKFQWVRLDDTGVVDCIHRFHMTKSAYIRQMEFAQGLDPRIPKTFLSFVPAADNVLDGKVKSFDCRQVANVADIAEAQLMCFDDKVQWFQ